MTQKRGYPYNLYIDILNRYPDVDIEELRSRIVYSMGRLPARSVQIIRQRYADGATLAEIGITQGVTGGRIRQIIGKATKQLQSYACAYILWYGVEAFEKKEIMDDDPLQLFELSTRVQNALLRAGYKTIGEVRRIATERSAADILTADGKRRIRNFGKVAFEEVRLIVSNAAH